MRFDRQYEAIRRAEDPAAFIATLPDEALVEALAGASRDKQPYLANILATELGNRVRRQNAILGAVGECLLALDPEGRVTFVNAAAAQILDRERGAIIGAQVHDLVHAGTRSHAPGEPCPLLSALRARGVSIRDDDLFARADAAELRVAWCLAPILRENEVEGGVLVFRDVTAQRRSEAERAAPLGPAGKPTRVLGFATDVTERHRLGLERRELMALSPCLMVVATLDGVLEEVNLAWENALGYSRQELRGRGCLEIVHPQDRAAFKGFLEKLAQGAHVAGFEARLVTKDGSAKRFTWNGRRSPSDALLFGLGVETPGGPWTGD